MTACTQPGCAGSIVDGYCDVCGMPPEDGASTGGSSAPTNAGSSAPSAGSVPDGTPCTQPGCAGKIVDGYCDVCGTPAQSAPGASAPAEPAGVADVGTSPTASYRLESSQLGSRRVTGTTGVTRRVRSGSTRTRAARLGAGLTTVPPAPPVDPAAVVQTTCSS